MNYTAPTDCLKELIKPYTGSIKQLLRDFFFYYSKFDYANQVRPYKFCIFLSYFVFRLFVHYWVRQYSNYHLTKSLKKIYQLK